MDFGESYHDRRSESRQQVFKKPYLLEAWSEPQNKHPVPSINVPICSPIANQLVENAGCSATVCPKVCWSVAIIAHLQAPPDQFHLHVERLAEARLRFHAIDVGSL